MRELIKSGSYSFVDGSRSITVTDWPSFNAHDIRLIYNETQDELLVSSGAKVGVSVVGSVINYPNTLPALVAGDILTIEIDFTSSMVPTETLINEMNVDRSIICQAVRDKGQNVGNTDPAVAVAAKIRAISSEINVQSTPGIPTDWHDLVEAIGSVNDVLNPYKYALLIPKGVNRVYLQGGNRFDMSDGLSTTLTGIYNFDTTKDELPAVKAFYEGKMAWMSNVVRIESVSFGGAGNVNLTVHVGETINEAITLHNSNAQSDKRVTLISGNGESAPTSGDSVISINGGYQGNAGRSTRWIVFSSSSPNPVHSFGVSIGDPAFSWARKVFQVYIYNVSIQGLNFDGCYITDIKFDDSYRLTNGSDDPTNNTFKFIQQAYQFRNNYIQNFRFPEFSNLILDSEKELNLNQLNLFNLSSLNSIVFPDGLQNLTISGANVFQSCTALTQIIFQVGIQNLTISGANVFSYCTALTQIIFQVGIQNLTISGANVFQSCAALTQIVFPDGLQNLTISGSAFYSCTALTQIIFQVGIQNLTISGNGAFSSCAALTQIVFPDGLQNLTISGANVFQSCAALSYVYFSKPTTLFLIASNYLGSITIPIKIEIEDRWNFSIDFSSSTNPNLNAAEMETFIIDRLLDLRSTAQENVFVKIETGALTTWSAVLSDGSPLVGHANFQEIFRVGQVVIVNIGGTNRSYTIADIPSNNQMIMTSSVSMVAGIYELNYGKVATFGATNLAKFSVAQKAKATTKKWQLA